MSRITIFATTVLCAFAFGCEGSVGPQGEQGEQGTTGPQGATGTQSETGATGEQGATGPQGSTGPQGEPGDSNFGFLTYAGQLDGHGFATFDLPEEAGSPTDPPAVVVYMSREEHGAYTPAMPSGEVTGASWWFIPSSWSPDLHRYVAVSVYLEYRERPGWYYRVVVIYWDDSPAKLARHDDESIRRIADSVTWQ